MKTLKNYHVLIFLLLTLPTSWVYAQQITLSPQVKAPLNITKYMEVFRDSTAKIPFSEIPKQKFKKHLKEYFILPYTADFIWIKLTVSNQSLDNANWILKWNNPLVEQLDFYVSDSVGGAYSHIQQKLLTRPREKPLIEQEPRFSFTLPKGFTKTIYLRVASQRGQYGSITLHSPESMAKHRFDDYTDQAFNNGLVIFRLFLVLTLSLFIIKELAFRIYSFHTVLKTLAYWGLMNIMGPLFTANPDLAKKIDFVSYNSITLGSGLFILTTFAIKYLPKWHVFIIVGIICSTIFTDVIIFFDYKWYWLKMGLYTIILSSLYFFGLYIYCFIKKIPVSHYYAIPFLLGLMSYFLINLRLLGIFEFKPLFAFASLLFVAEIFIFVIFLGRIFRNEERFKKIAEQKLSFNIEQNNRLKELDNLKTTFFTNISHELRTPLTLITGPVKELAEKYPSEKLIPLVQRNTQRLLTLINQLLDISKLEAGQMKPEITQENLTKYLRTLVSSFSSLAESRQIEFNIELSKAETLGHIDKDKIEKIITNLLSNAFKFTPPNGSVSIKTDYLNESKILQILISDTGIGIEKEKLAKIYDRFYQVDDAQNRKFEGTGIGLALVKELVNVLNGQIEVASKKDEGTTFTVRLPIDYQTWKEYIVETPEGSNVASENLGLAKNEVDNSTNNNNDIENQNILLIVDDNKDIRTYIRSIFEGEFKIIEAVNGKDGIEKASLQVPDIIISDLMMPEMDGFEFCKLLKSDERTSHIPIVMLTAKANIESRIEGLELGADDYLIKPFDANEIKVRVRNLLAIRETLKNYYQKGIIDLKPTQIKVNSVDESFILRAKEVIERNLSDSKFDIELFADSMSVSSVQLRRKIKALTNQTVVEFIRYYRIERAAQLLSQNAGNISEIAFQVGFDSVSYFGKIFQDIHGVSPSEYRSNNQK